MNESRILVLGGSICRVLRGFEALGGSFVRVLRVGEAHGGSSFERSCGTLSLVLPKLSR